MLHQQDDSMTAIFNYQDEKYDEEEREKERG
jgi:hypothetical protein